MIAETIIAAIRRKERQQSVSATDELLALITEAGARMTFDGGSDCTKPCVCCGGSDLGTDGKPWNDLYVLGSYVIATRGGILPRDAMRRPVCSKCRAEPPLSGARP